MKRLFCLLSFLLLISVLTACTPSVESGGTPVADHKWLTTQEWAVTQTDAGTQAITIDAPAEATAWYDASLKDNWIVSTELKLLKATGDTDCARVVFRDEFENPCLTVTVEYVGTSHVQLRVDAFTNTGESSSIGGWKNLYTADNWTKIASENNLFLIICRTGKDSFTVSLSQYDTSIVPETTVTLEERYLDLPCQAGVATYGSYVRFTGFAIL